MTGPYIKIVYDHKGSPQYHHIVYVSEMGVEVDISNVIGKVTIHIDAGEVPRFVLEGHFPVVQVLDDECGSWPT